MAVVYDQLRQIAGRQMAKSLNQADLQPTALVHEAYLRLFEIESTSWENRRHFFFAAARAMRHILVENARRHGARKRGGSWKRVESPDGAIVAEDSDRFLVLNDAIDRLHTGHPRAAGVVMLRFFGGLSHADVAQTLGLSSATVRREWMFAKAWLKKELGTPTEDQ